VTLTLTQAVRNMLVKSNRVDKKLPNRQTDGQTDGYWGIT